MSRKDVCVIGGGAAGCIAAVFAAQNGASVLLIEQNEKVGKKLYITGNGRCNLTNNSEPAVIIQNVVSNPRFCMGAVNRFTPKQAMELFESHGVRLKTERGNRVFPVSDKSSDILKALSSMLKTSGCEVLLSAAVLKITKADNGFRISTSNGEYFSSRLIIATGGKSYQSTGSTGDGYRFARELGHSVVAPMPALCPIILKDDVSAMEGLSLKNVGLKAVVGGKEYSAVGEMLFTSNGISGPLTLSLSSQITRLSLVDAYVSIDFKPALSTEMLDKRVLQDFAECTNKFFKNSLDKLLPKAAIFDIIRYTRINPDKPVNQITQAERAALVSALKDFRLAIDRLDDINRAIITSGGVSVGEISPSTMESKLVKGLYFAGEVIDIDAYTGGFNIQLAMSTGYVAGVNAGRGEDYVRD